MVRAIWACIDKKISIMQKMYSDLLNDMNSGLNHMLGLQTGCAKIRVLILIPASTIKHTGRILQIYHKNEI